MHDRTEVEQAVREALAALPTDYSYVVSKIDAEGDYPMVDALECVYWIEQPDGSRRPACLVGHLLAHMGLLDQVSEMDNSTMFASIDLALEFDTRARDLLMDMQGWQDENQDMQWRTIAQKVGVME